MRRSDRSGALIAALMPVTYVPAFSLWLPSLLLK
jgi:hypothetical protein